MPLLPAAVGVAYFTPCWPVKHINEALRAGKRVHLFPGTYRLSEPIVVPAAGLLTARDCRFVLAPSMRV
jgi:hypothetical protein